MLPDYSEIYILENDTHKSLPARKYTPSLAWSRLIYQGGIFWKKKKKALGTIQRERHGWWQRPCIRLVKELDNLQVLVCLGL